MSTILSPNMSLPVPGVGTEPGPDWATDLNSCMSVIDGHDHSSGSGVPITPSGLNINADLNLNSNNLTAVRAVRLNSQSVPLSLPSDLRCLYSVSSDLYYNDGSGTDIRITQNGAVAGTPGSIANLVSPASAAYVSANSTFVLQSAANTPANLDIASVVLRNLTANSKGLTLAPPSAMASDSTITLPPLPSSNSVVSVDTSGNMGSIPQINAVMPPGMIIAYGGLSAPSGWLMCDGSAVSRSTYASLFSAVSVAFGSGDGSTTFNVPDFRGRFLRGVDNGAGRDPDVSTRTAMNTGGATQDNPGSIEGDAFASHTHVEQLADPTNQREWRTAQTQAGTGAFKLVAGINDAPLVGSGTPVITEATGSSSETRPTNAYVNYLIKT